AGRDPGRDAQRHRHRLAGHHRLQHRAQLQGSHAEPTVAADRDRPGAVRGDLRHQLLRALDRGPQRAQAGQGMSTVALSHANLPRWAPALVGVVSLAAAGLPAMVLGWGLFAWLVASVVLFLVALPAWSLVVEDRRSA